MFGKHIHGAYKAGDNKLYNQEVVASVPTNPKSHMLTKHSPNYHRKQATCSFIRFEISIFCVYLLL
jgi:hypothetical protein